MTVDPTTSQSVGLYTTAPNATAPKKELDNETFLNLLVTQLRYQDPSSPMDTTEMMAQTTQLASMERLTEISKAGQESFSLQMRVAAASLIGEQVSYVDEAGETVTGVASAVSFMDAVPTVTVGDAQVPLDAVSAVTRTSSGPAT